MESEIIYSIKGRLFKMRSKFKYEEKIFSINISGDLRGGLSIGTSWVL